MRAHFRFPSLQMAGKYNTHRWNFDGTYQDQSVRGETVDIKISCESVVNENMGKIAIQLKSDSQVSLVSVISDYRGVAKYGKFVVSPTSIELDANIIHPVSFKAKVYMIKINFTVYANNYMYLNKVNYEIRMYFFSRLMFHPIYNFNLS